jgi:hypothetical protein
LYWYYSIFQDDQTGTQQQLPSTFEIWKGTREQEADWVMILLAGLLFQNMLV